MPEQVLVLRYRHRFVLAVLGAAFVCANWMNRGPLNYFGASYYPHLSSQQEMMDRHLELIQSTMELEGLKMELEKRENAFNASIAVRLEQKKLEEEKRDDYVAACVMIMDGNHELIEWLAHHYHTLPLRRLIILNDPFSKTTPGPIVQRWNGRMDISVWNDTNVFPKGPPNTEGGAKGMYIRRQKEFNKKCMKQLNDEGHRWAQLFDPDEYVAINDRVYNQNDTMFGLNLNRKRIRIPSMREAGAVLKFIHAVRDYIQKYGVQNNDYLKPFETACIGFNRKQFGTHETNDDDNEEDDFPLKNLSSKDLSTCRWRYWGNRIIIGKALVDLKIIDWWEISGNIHIPTNDKWICRPRNAWNKESVMPLVMNHYAATLDQALFRSGDSRGGAEGRLKRHEKEKQYKDNHEPNSHILEWLPGFIESVGKDEAERLLSHAGKPYRASMGAYVDPNQVVSEEEGMRLQENLIQEVKELGSASAKEPPAVPPTAIASAPALTAASPAPPTEETTTDRGPKFLWGIFSMDSDKERQRRQMLRETYLLHFKHKNRASGSEHRICSLPEYRKMKAQAPEAYKACQIIYAFVMGSNHQGSPTLCNITNHSIPLTIVPPSHLMDEPDIVHLNMRENLNEGKSPSWFAYGVSLVDAAEEALVFDYITKADIDTVVLPEKWFAKVEALELPVPSKKNLVYGGAVLKPSFNEKKWLKGTGFYMQGGLYFLSVELARHVTSPQLDRDSLEDYKYVGKYGLNGTGHEDPSMSNFVFSHPKRKEIRRASLGMMRHHLKEVGYHPMKDMGQFRKFYYDNTAATPIDNPTSTSPTTKPTDKLSTNPALTPNAKPGKHLPADAKKDEDKVVSVVQSYSDFIASLEVGWAAPPADWMKAVCPQVVDHYIKFPSFKENHIYANVPPAVPLQTTEYAVKTLCTLRVVHRMASAINTKLYLHAGSHLGAVLHGQPIPWDDDADAFMDCEQKDAFFELCKDGHVVQEGVIVKCVIGHNAIKVWLQIDGMTKETSDSKPWHSPYVDLFLYQKTNGFLQEVNPKGKTFQQRHKFPISEYFPTVPYYFGGLILWGPPSSLAAKRYKFDVCRTGDWNHRLEQPFNLKQALKGWTPVINCTALQQKFPFKTAYNELTVGEAKHAIFGIPEEDQPPRTLTSTDDRSAWGAVTDETRGQNLTDQLPNLNSVEIDNSIAPDHLCSGPIKVIEFNAERGRWWTEAADIMKDYDLIILNEVDIGMARSDQQHVTRQMAHYLGMNYAWGLEFVELTLGDAHDRKFLHPTEDSNQHGLHGNAFLTKCQITDAKIFRDPVGKYFSDHKIGLNAQGLEKRLGGRMAMLGRIVVDGKTLVVGSTHEHAGDLYPIKDYIGSSSAIIAGDQEERFCLGAGLKNVMGGKNHNTWPATCSTSGRKRGDNICSNLEVDFAEDVMLPCKKEYNFELLLSDHAFTSVTLALKSEAKSS